jgi:hypothetical protein
MVDLVETIKMCNAIKMNEITFYYHHEHISFEKNDLYLPFLQNNFTFECIYYIQCNMLSAGLFVCLFVWLFFYLFLRFFKGRSGFR